MSPLEESTGLLLQSIYATTRCKCAQLYLVFFHAELAPWPCFAATSGKPKSRQFRQGHIKAVSGDSSYQSFSRALGRYCNNPSSVLEIRGRSYHSHRWSRSFPLEFCGHFVLKCNTKSRRTQNQRGKNSRGNAS